jgi:hypothetical protein
VIYVPNPLGGLAALCGQARHYALHAVRVLEYQGGAFRLEASDGRRLAIVRGAGGHAPPELAGLEAPADPVYEALIPADAWRDGFNQAGKAPGVALLLGRNAVTLAAGAARREAPNFRESERWPDVARALPRPPAWAVAVDPKLLSGLLLAAAACAEAAGGAGPVQLLLYPKVQYVGVTFNAGGRLIFDGLLVGAPAA